MTISEIKEYGYKKVELIATGGNGMIYTGVGTDNKLVVIKTLKPAATDDLSLFRLNREAQLMEKLTKRGVKFIPQYIGRLGLNGPIIMEYLGGEDLTKYYPNAATNLDHFLNRLIVSKTINRRFAELKRKHDVYHRDINNANIRIFNGKAYIIDFGTSVSSDRRRQEMATQPMTLLGTMKYTAPEKLQGEHTSQATEIYSLGIVLFRMMLGVKEEPYGKPLSLDTATTLMMMKDNKVVKIGDKSLTTLAHKSGKIVDNLIAKCLEPKPWKRLSSFKSLDEAIDDAIENINALKAKPDKKWWQRKIKITE